MLFYQFYGSLSKILILYTSPEVRFKMYIDILCGFMKPLLPTNLVKALFPAKPSKADAHYNQAATKIQDIIFARLRLKASIESTSK